LPVVSLQGKVAPFGIGTYARVFARYVREERALSLAQAITKASLLPARVLQGYSPAFRRKGRIRVGADADLTVFDPARIEDHATYAAPFEPSTGIRHVIVGGVFALRDGEVLENSFPGSRIRR
jgi:N-acyl-D-aspartate/D-glutamate deacylase